MKKLTLRYVLTLMVGIFIGGTIITGLQEQGQERRLEAAGVMGHQTATAPAGGYVLKYGEGAVTSPAADGLYITKASFRTRVRARRQRSDRASNITTPCVPQRTLELEPTFVMTHLWRGMTYEKMSRLDVAISNPGLSELRNKINGSIKS